MYVNEREGRAIADSYLKEVRFQIEQQLKEQIWPQVEISIKEAAEKALEEIKPMFFSYMDTRGYGQFCHELMLKVDDKIK